MKEKAQHRLLKLHLSRLVVEAVNEWLSRWVWELESPDFVASFASCLLRDRSEGVKMSQFSSIFYFQGELRSKGPS